jgi:hypothetical protein
MNMSDYDDYMDNLKRCYHCSAIGKHLSTYGILFCDTHYREFLRIPCGYCDYNCTEKHNCNCGCHYPNVSVFNSNGDE